PFGAMHQQGMGEFGRGKSLDQGGFGLFHSLGAAEDVMHEAPWKGIKIVKAGWGGMGAVTPAALGEALFSRGFKPIHGIEGARAFAHFEIDPAGLHGNRSQVLAGPDLVPLANADSR